MNNDDIEKLKLLANNSDHLVKIIMDKMIKEANEENEHQMCVPFGYGDANGNLFCEGLSSYCEKCVYQISIQVEVDELNKTEKIRIMEGNITFNCMGDIEII